MIGKEDMESSDNTVCDTPQPSPPPTPHDSPAPTDRRGKLMRQKSFNLSSDEEDEEEVTEMYSDASRSRGVSLDDLPGQADAVSASVAQFSLHDSGHCSPMTRHDSRGSLVDAATSGR